MRRKLPGPIGVRATGIVEARAMGVARPTAILGSSRMSVATKKKMICKVIKGIYQEMTGRKEKENWLRIKDTYPWPWFPAHHHHYPHQNKKTLVFMTGSSSESSRTSSNPSSENKSASSLRVAELGMEDGVTIKEEPSFTTWEKATKGSLAKVPKGVAGEALPVWDAPIGVTSF